jgi:HAD superfamily hydrolase (TIGR01459 family)
MIRLPDLTGLLPRYQAFLIDQFGTLHDGSSLYPGAAEALRRLRAAGRTVVLLSNSGKPAAANAERLRRLGIGPELYDWQLSSGEAARRLLLRDAVPVARGRRTCLLLERDGDGTILDGLGLTAAGPEAAELVVIGGSEGERRPLEWYAALFADPVRRGVPALCINPDRTMLTPHGPAYGAGRIGELYAELGGTVSWIGKPYRDIYDMVLADLGGVPPARIAMIGDSVEHDIAGARAAGCAAWLVRGGIIEGWSDAEIAAEFARRNVTPDGMLDAFALPG